MISVLVEEPGLPKSYEGKYTLATVWHSLPGVKCSEHMSRNTCHGTHVTGLGSNTPPVARARRARGT